MTTFVALSDSITFGVGDPVRRDGSRAWRGWAALLAETMPEPSLHILASCGGRAVDVERCQLPAALRLPDPGQLLGLPGSLARQLSRRMHEVNAAMDGLAERFGTVHYDAAGDPDGRDPRMWAVDRLHPSERGHRRIACRFHDQLAAAGVVAGPRPDPEPSSPPPSRAAEIGWLATKGTAWVLRRSTDLVPGLVALAIRERWAGEFPVTAATLESVAAGPDVQPVR